MQELLPFLVAAVVVELIGLEILHYLRWGLDFVQELYLYDVIVGTVMAHCGSLPLNYCQWMEQPQLMELSLGIVMVVHAVVLPTILRN